MPQRTSILVCNPRFTVLLDESPGQVYLIDELESAVLFGDAVAEILRRIDGRRTLDSIAAEVAPALGAGVVDRVIEQLIDDGIVTTQT